MNHPSSRCVVPPTTEPLSLDEVKEHLRIESSAEDALLQVYIEAAREICEHNTSRVLVTQTWESVFDAFPDSSGDEQGVQHDMLVLARPATRTQRQGLALALPVGPFKRLNLYVIEIKTVNGRRWTRMLMSGIT